MNAEKRKLKITNSIMQKTFASAHILTILYKDEGKLHYFRVTTLLADSTLPTSHCRPVPHSSGGLFLLTVDIRPRLLGIAFDRSCSQGIANPCLAAVLHDRRLSVSGDTDTSCPVQSIWLLNDSYNRPLFAVCQPDRRRKMQFWQHLQIRQY